MKNQPGFLILVLFASTLGKH